MSTLVSLVLAAVLNFLGAEIPKEAQKLTQGETIQCEASYQDYASNCIIKNEQLFKLNEIE